MDNNIKTMTWEELKQFVSEEYKNRNLKSGQRPRELERIIEFLEKKYPNGPASAFCLSKELLKKEYWVHKGKNLNDAEKSVFNELLKQFIAKS